MLVVSSTFAVGVNVAVYVTVPSGFVVAADRLLSAPLGDVRSVRSKPLTASLKVIVTVAVSPAFSAVSLISIVAVGAVVS